MNHAAICHGSTLPYRQPLARNRIRFRLFAAQGDLSAVTLCCWKRDEPAPDSLRKVALRVRYSDGLRDEWVCEAEFSAEVHYLKYYFLLRDSQWNERYLCERGVLDAVPQEGLFELLQANETDVLTLPEWSRGIVYYQIFPERFAVGNSGKKLREYMPWDAKPDRSGYFGGDLNGVREKLPYLQSLGVECLYLTPVFLGDFNHKYATTDYFSVDPDFGSNEDLTALVREAHAAGIRVLLDGVFNHTGVRFAPFSDILSKGKASPYCEWFYLKRFPVTEDAACYECVGDYAWMPRLRTANPKVREYILSVMLYWLKTAAIDGWRLDVSDEIDASTLRYLRENVKRQYPDALLLGETWGDASRMICEGDQLDCAMNYLFRDAAIDFFATETIGARELKHRLSHLLMKYPDEVNQRMYNCISSHDTARFLTRARGETWRLKLAVALQMLFPGSPAVYYGDELGMIGESDPDCRGGMAWEHSESDLLEWTREMIVLRKQDPAARLGDYHMLLTDFSDDVFVMERRYGDARLLAYFNRGGTPQTLDFSDATGTVTVPPRSVKIIQT
ncbi:MAG: glycoside hydrolase family 13 protein [Bacillota bacterium]